MTNDATAPAQPGPLLGLGSSDGLAGCSASELQAGMSNDDLAAAWARKLPGVAATDRDMTAFALGVEVGATRYAETWDALRQAIENYQRMSSQKDRATAAMYQFHYAMKDAGWHPGRTDDNLCEILRAKGKELSAAMDALQRAKDSLVAFKFMPTSTTGHPWEDTDEANLAAVNAALGWCEPANV